MYMYMFIIAYYCPRINIKCASLSSKVNTQVYISILNHPLVSYNSIIYTTIYFLFLQLLV